MEKGFIQIYTGNGKGKTTAAIGLAVRAAGTGKRVFIGQFLKGISGGEHKALSRFEDLITIKQYGTGKFIHDRLSDEDLQLARAGWDEIMKVVEKNSCDILIIDELGCALFYNLISIKEVKGLLKKKPVKMELVITGRDIPAQLFTFADLITEMREIKHYMKKNISAREGIEY